MKPTVSVSSKVSPPFATRRLVDGSNVANRRSSTATSADVSRLKSIDLPALVYPTRATARFRVRLRDFDCERR